MTKGPTEGPTQGPRRRPATAVTDGRARCPVAGDPAPRLGELLASPDRDAHYGRLAAGEAVVRGRYFDDTELWLVTGYDANVTVLTDPRFSNDLTRQALVPVPGAHLPPDLRRPLTSTLATCDPPDHTRLRRLVSRAFTNRRVRGLRPRIEHIVDDLLAHLPDHADPDGTVDLDEHFAHQLPCVVIGELLGIPADDQKRWRASAAGLIGDDPDRTIGAARDLVASMREEIAARRAGAKSGDDLLTALVREGENERDRPSDDELISLALSILLAGHRTTAHLVRSLAILVLTDAIDPADGDAGRNGAVVEELLRRHGPAEIGTLRVATDDIDLAGVTIRRGELVLAVLASGNRDPRRFGRADARDPGRTDNAHLAFGHGPHYCLGAALAREMAECALLGLGRARPGLTLAREVALTLTDPRSTAVPVRRAERTEVPDGTAATGKPATTEKPATTAATEEEGARS